MDNNYHDFECYRIWVAPIVLEHFMNKDERLYREVKKRVGQFYFFDRLNNYISSKERPGMTSDELLKFVLDFKD